MGKASREYSEGVDESRLLKVVARKTGESRGVRRLSLPGAKINKVRRLCIAWIKRVSSLTPCVQNIYKIYWIAFYNRFLSIPEAKDVHPSPGDVQQQ